MGRTVYSIFTDPEKNHKKAPQKGAYIGGSKHLRKQGNYLEDFGRLLGCPAGSDRFTIVIVSWFISPTYGTYPTCLY